MDLSAGPDLEQILSSTRSISSVARQVKQGNFVLLNRLRSIDADANFVAEFSRAIPKVPVVANLRCGAWYASPSISNHTCYFKSSDGHTPHWQFNLRRLNLHLLELASKNNGAVIIDSTRKGKRFPDSMSRTIPIWCCVINRAVECLRKSGGTWDTDLHLPVWVSPSEASQMGGLIDEFVESLLSSAADLTLMESLATKPLRTIWVDRKSSGWSAEQHASMSDKYIPIVCLSVSNVEADVQRQHRRGWHYIQGAGDDHENWARSITPALFWQHHQLILGASDNVECTEVVDRIVKEHTQCGNGADQAAITNVSPVIGSSGFVISTCSAAPKPSDSLMQHYSSVIWCSSSPVENRPVKSRILTLEVVDSKSNKRSLQLNLPKALQFVQNGLANTESLPMLIACDDDDHSVPVCLVVAALAKFFDLEEGEVRRRQTTASKRDLSKCSIRCIVQFVQRFLPECYPSRLLMQQLNRFLL